MGYGPVPGRSTRTKLQGLLKQLQLIIPSKTSIILFTALELSTTTFLRVSLFPSLLANSLRSGNANG
jgi:hypothetical protein